MGWLDDAQDAYDSGKDLVSESLPSGLDDLSGLGSESIDNLVDFASSPFVFIMELFINNLVLPAATIVIKAVQFALKPFAGLPSTVGEPLGNAGTTVYNGLSGVIMTLNDAVVSASAAAGPAAPLVVLVFWAGIAVVVAWSVRNAIALLPEAIPWL